MGSSCQKVEKRQLTIDSDLVSTDYTHKIIVPMIMSPRRLLQFENISSEKYIKKLDESQNDQEVEWNIVVKQAESPKIKQKFLSPKSERPRQCKKESMQYLKGILKPHFHQELQSHSSERKVRFENKPHPRQYL